MTDNLDRMLTREEVAKIFGIKCARARKWNGFSLKMERTSLTVERRGH